MTTLQDVLESSAMERVATGFRFTEGPLWHRDGFFYFVDVRSNLLYRMVLGQAPETVRETQGGNGTTFDLQGRLINCEGDGRRVTRTEHDGSVTTLIDRFEGKRLNRPNDLICHSRRRAPVHRSDLRVPLGERESSTRRFIGWRRTARSRGGAVRVSERAGAVAGRADAVRGEYSVGAVYPRD